MSRAVFLDRDGTINREVEYLSRQDDFEFLPNALDAFKILAESEYKIIVVTNQSAVGRGYLTQGELDKIHQQMTRQITRNKGRIDRIYMCPHQPEENCACRKPRTAMLKKAADEFNINLKESYMVGDKTADIQTGINAGCKTILVKTGYAGKDGKYHVKADYEAKDLLDAVKNVILSIT